MKRINFFEKVFTHDKNHNKSNPNVINNYDPSQQVANNTVSQDADGDVTSKVLGDNVHVLVPTHTQSMESEITSSPSLNEIKVAMISHQQSSFSSSSLSSSNLDKSNRDSNSSPLKQDKRQRKIIKKHMMQKQKSLQGAQYSNAIGSNYSNSNSHHKSKFFSLKSSSTLSSSPNRKSKKSSRHLNHRQEGSSQSQISSSSSSQQITLSEKQNNNNNSTHKSLNQEEHHSLTHKFSQILSNIFHSHSKDTNDDDNAENNNKHRRHVHRIKPQVLLYGTTTPDEHYDKIDEYLELAKISHLYGEEGLKMIGFEYRRIPCKSCLSKQQQQQQEDMNEHSTDSISLKEIQQDDNDQDDKVINGVENDKDPQDCRNNTHYSNDHPTDLHQEEPSMVSSIQSNAQSNTNTNTVEEQQINPSSQPPKSKQQEQQQDEEYSCYDCTTRLHHIESNTMITESNRKKFIADGDMYELLARLCQEYAQDWMIKDGDLEWVSVCNDLNKGQPIRALVHKDSIIDYTSSATTTTAPNQDQDDVDNGSNKSNSTRRSSTTSTSSSSSSKSGSKDITPSTLLITTGKGKVRAGIFSRQHLLVSGVEASTALPMIREAKKRGMRIVVLDPNARGDRNGMGTYEASMKLIFGEHGDDGVGVVDDDSTIRSISHSSNSKENIPKDIPSLESKIRQTSTGIDGTSTESSNQNDESKPACLLHDGPLYILAHSASGSQLTRYLSTQGRHLIDKIHSIAFTDSTHSIQWLKNHANLLSLVQSPSSLYVRSSNINRDDDWSKRKAGDVCDSNDSVWQHRFGRVKTIWAGTTDHSLCNWTSHFHIWEHFDRCDEGSKSLGNDGSGHTEQN